MTKLPPSAAGTAPDDGAGRDDPVARCTWCHRLLPPNAGVGRPRRYCRPACRQRAFEERRRLEEASWSEEALRGRERTLDQVALLAAVLGDVVEERTVGPLEDLQPGDVGDLLDRIRSCVDELRRTVEQPPAYRTEPERT